MQACPGDDTITLFTCGQLDGAGKAEIEAHVAGCEHCKKLVGVLRHTMPHVAGSTTTASTLFAKTFGLLPPGTAIGRYQIEGLVGAGGMGVVYAAHDPELDRKVALKLLYPRRRPLGTQPGDSDLEERLRGESKAMARLKHPNVATIHDIGRYGDQLFLVLEYVAGGTLRAWVDERKSWETVLETFRSAGKGLAAAHATGIVHCDFKPDNVLIASDGHPVVTDFGLAQLIAEARARDSAEQLATSTASPPVVGTPAYMAPERFDATSRAHVQGDVFGFCVSLYEVLYGVRPFHGTTVAELAGSIATAEIPRPSQAVPEWLHRVLVRGLSADLAVRHQTIDELLAELTPKPRRRLALWAAVAGVALLGGAGAWMWLRPAAETCDPHRELAGIWDDVMRARVTGALAASPAQGRTLRAIDQYADAWSAVVCKQPASEVQQRCMRSAKVELGAITHAIAEGGPAVAKRGDLYVADLPAIEDCSGNAPTKPMPTDPALRGDVDKLRDQLAAAAALDIAAQFDAAKTKLDDLEPKAEKLGYRPLVAEIKYERALNIEGISKSADVQAQAFRDAAASAQASGHEVLAVRAWQSLATDAARSGDFTRGREYASYAQAALERIGGDRRLEARLEIVRGNIDLHDGKLDVARKHFARASALTDDNPLSHIDALDGLARTDTEARKLTDALAEQLQILDLRRKLYTEDHPEIARSYTTLGNVTMLLGRSAESLDYYQKADATAQRVFGPDHPLIAFTAHNLGGILRDLHRPVEAETAYRRALAVGNNAFGPDHPNVAKTQQSLGMALFDQGKFADAVTELEHAVAIKRKAYGDDHVETLGAINDLGIALRGAGRFAEAIELAATAVAGFTKAYGPDHPEVGQALVAQGRTLAAAHRDKDAAASLDRAEAIFKHGESNPEALTEIAEARKTLYSRGRTQ